MNSSMIDIQIDNIISSRPSSNQRTERASKVNNQVLFTEKA
jgi:hypothetical protein